MLPRRTLLTASLGTLLAGCSSAPRSGPTAGTVRLGASDDPRSLDPAIAYDTFSWVIVRACYSTLLDYDSETRLVPNAAAAYTVSPDGRTLTFRLRRGMRFADGEPVTAAAFRFAIERVLDPTVASPAQGFYAVIAGSEAYREALAAWRADGSRGPRPRLAGIETPDAQTIRYHLRQPQITFLNLLAMPFAAGLSRQYVERVGKRLAERPLGSGPYRLREWRRGRRIVLERNPHYFDPEFPRNDRVEIRLGLDGLVQTMMFERGELDLTNIPPEEHVRMTQSPRWRRLVVAAPRVATIYLSLNTELPPFDRREVRQAINYALNRDRLIQIGHRRDTPARGVLPPLMPGYDPHLRGYNFDPSRARALLAGAGMARGFATTLWYVPDSTSQRMVEAIQQDLHAVGVRVTLQPTSPAVFLDKTGRRRTVPMAFVGWFQDYPDPSNFFEPLLHSRAIQEENSTNLAFYRNPDVDRLIDEAAALLDRERRIALYRRAERIVVEDAPWVFLFHPTEYFVVQPWVTGAQPHPVWPLVPERIAIRSQEAPPTD